LGYRGEYFSFYCSRPAWSENGLAAAIGRKINFLVSRFLLREEFLFLYSSQLQIHTDNFQV
jgi:hypothetical protein